MIIETQEEEWISTISEIFDSSMNEAEERERLRALVLEIHDDGVYQGIEETKAAISSYIAELQP